MLDLLDIIENLRNEIDKIEDEKNKKIEKIKEEYNIELEKYQHALTVIKNMNEVCPKCKGRGVYQELDGAGVHYCEMCNHTGKVLKNQCNRNKQ